MSRSKHAAQKVRRSSAKDFDPEDDQQPDHDGSAASDDSSDGARDDGREHYVDVGKGYLRQHPQPDLGAIYSASVVNRNALRDESEDDPFAPQEDAYDDEDPFALSAEETQQLSDDSDPEELSVPVTRQNGAVPARDGGDQPDLELSAESDEYEDDVDSEAEGTDLEDSKDDSLERLQKPTFRSGGRTRSDSRTRRDEIKQLSAQDATTVAATLSATTTQDTIKGLAIQRQQAAYDRLLDSRIKLQKALKASNDLSVDFISDEESQALLDKAEAAAASTLEMLASIRGNMDGSGKVVQAKTSAIVATAPSEAVWNEIQREESVIIIKRQAVLNKWSANTKAAVPGAASQPPFVDSMQRGIHTEQARIADLSLSTSEKFTYSDDDFYQALLRELVLSRTQAAGPVEASSVLPTKLHQSGSARKAVDTRASKGRKLRYAVHEKLQNFMAPEDRTTWSDAARSEFFGSLFGQNMLEEDLDFGNDPAQHQEASLRLFRTV